MRIILSGGGTGGSVTPLLAVAQKIKELAEETPEFLWLGSRNGPEKKLIKGHNIKFRSIYSGKFRRYFSMRNFTDLFLILIGFFQSLFILARFKADITLSAGSFVSVPIVLAGWFLRIPSVIHQQDIVPGMANKLMAPFARKITVTFNKSLKDFPEGKTIWTGNPVRASILLGKREEARRLFNLEQNLPTLLVVGGGTGALILNQLISQIAPQLVKFCQIIHLTGEKKQFKLPAGKAGDLTQLPEKQAVKQFNNRYHPFKFLTEEMADAYAAADLIISRAGMGTLTELMALGKPAILIPIPDTHQEENAKIFAYQGAALNLSQKEITPKILLQEIKRLLADKNQLNFLSKNVGKLVKPNAAEKIAKIVLRLT